MADTVASELTVVEQGEARLKAEAELKRADPEREAAEAAIAQNELRDENERS